MAPEPRRVDDLKVDDLFPQAQLPLLGVFFAVRAGLVNEWVERVFHDAFSDRPWGVVRAGVASLRARDDDVAVLQEDFRKVAQIGSQDAEERLDRSTSSSSFPRGPQACEFDALRLDCQLLQLGSGELVIVLQPLLERCVAFHPLSFECCEWDLRFDISPR